MLFSYQRCPACDENVRKRILSFSSLVRLYGSVGNRFLLIWLAQFLAWRCPLSNVERTTWKSPFYRRSSPIRSSSSSAHTSTITTSTILSSRRFRHLCRSQATTLLLSKICNVFHDKDYRDNIKYLVGQVWSFIRQIQSTTKRRTWDRG